MSFNFPAVGEELLTRYLFVQYSGRTVVIRWS